MHPNGTAGRDPEEEGEEYDEVEEEESEDDEEDEGEEDDDEGDEDEGEEEDDEDEEEEDDEGEEEYTHDDVVYPLDYRPHSWEHDHPFLALAAVIIADAIDRRWPGYEQRQRQRQCEQRLAELREAEDEGDDVCFKCETINPPRCDEGHCLKCTRKCNRGHCQKCRSCNLCPYCGCGGGGPCGCDD